MSAGRSYRRAIRGRINQPAGAVELDAETRQLLARVLAAHADPTVTTSDFLPLLQALWTRLDGMSKPERLEVAGQVLARSLGGRYVGWGAA